MLGNSRDPVVQARVRELLKNPVDLLFIDGDHAYDAVKADFDAYRPLVAGWAAFHDILDTPLHRDRGCRVDRLWQELRQHTNWQTIEWSVGGPWGGIGAVKL